MNINRETYEEFFLLYADNELSAGMRKEVEAFVETNPDLKAELELFLSLRLQPDLSLRMEDKSSLLKAQDQVTGMEEKMLMHLDGELPAEEAAKLESAIRSNETLQEEWAMLNRTRLEADEDIRYPGKAGLYRYETSEVRVVRFRWIQYAAAAVVILVAGLLWINQGPDAGQTGGQLAMNNSSKNTETENGFQPVREEASAPVSAPMEQGAAKLADTGERLVAEKIEKSLVPAVKNTESPAPREAASAETGGQLQEANIGQIATVRNQEPIMAAQEVNAPRLNNSPDIARASTDIIDQAAGMQQVKSDYATQALMNNYEEVNTIDIMDQESDRNRKSLRGLVRKANRFLNKVTNPDLERPSVKVANIEVSLGR